MQNIDQDVRSTIDQVIRSFDAEDPESYLRWDGELQRLEMALAMLQSPEQPLLLGSVLAQRISLAYDVDDFELVVELSTRFKSRISTRHPSFYGVLVERTDALHALESHATEIKEALEAARSQSLDGQEALPLLARLTRRHPGSVNADPQLIAKVQEAVRTMRQDGYTSLPEISGEPEVFEREIQEAVAELKRLHRARAEELLAQP